MIHYYRHNEINKSAWDNCIENSQNGLIYACSWYLDIVCPGWGALVEGNYEALMPLPVKRKWGIKYIYQPHFAQQLGIFGHSISKNTVEPFLNQIPKSFAYINYNLNSSNYLNPEILKSKLKNNYILSLIPKYSELFNSYSINTKRNIKKASGYNLKIEPTLELRTYIELLKKYNPYKMSENQYITLSEILKELLYRKKGSILGVKGEDGNLLASVFFIEALNRSIYIFPVSTENGKKMLAMSFLIDFYIRENCLSPRILDFEGSNIENIARFYKGFGAINQPYFEIIMNRMPFWIKWLKK